MQAAQTILAQLGGSRFCAMTGASQFVGGDAPVMLQFKIGRGAKNKATNVRVTLADSDTYAVEFFSIRGVNVKPISQHGMVYADQLRGLFTEQTGMVTSL
jgi:hypothetical protein